MTPESEPVQEETEPADRPRGAKRRPPAKQRELAIAALSPRQAEIVELVAMGLSDKEIGRRLHLAEETVGWHLKKIFLKWGVHSRTALASRRLRQTPPKRTLSGLPSPTNVGVVAVSGK